MTVPQIFTAVLARAGLPAAEAAAWAAAWAAAAPAAAGPAPVPAAGQAAPAATGAQLRPAADALSAFAARGQGLLRRLPGPGRGTTDEQAARAAVTGALNEARDGFLRAHAVAVYDLVTAGRTRSLRADEFVYQTAARFPGLVPAPAEMAAEQARPLPEKEGIEFAQGLLLAHVLAVPETGQHLIQAMLRPTPAAAERLPQLQATGAADLGPVTVTRRGRAGLLELSNPRHLNAEDDVTLGPTECAVDLILLDPAIDVGVIRGAPAGHPRYPGVRVFGSGLNLTRLYRGQLGYLFFMLRDLGFVHKIYRGLALDGTDGGVAGPGPAAGDVARPGAAGRPAEKPWIAAVERFAVGGACQLLLVVDHVLATRGSQISLPARAEGIIPGAANLRLPRFTGDRAARQAILSGRQWIAGEPDAALLCDEVVEPGAMDSAIGARVDALTSAGLASATANRAMLRAGQEPLEAFRAYMAVFAREQARCYLSPALVGNLQARWKPARNSG